jgi:hypothetical protein
MACNSSFYISPPKKAHTSRLLTGFDYPLQEGTFMTHEELEKNQEYMWRALFGEQRMTLTLAVEMLLRCHLSPQQILTKTMRALEGSQQDS